MNSHVLWAGASYGIAAACLYWVFHNIPLHALLRSFTKVNWWFVPPAIALNLLVYLIAGWEWKILLCPIGRLKVRQTTQAVLAGRFANDVLPVHVGYVVRIYLVSRWTRCKVASIAPSLLVERLFDGFWLALGIGLTAIFFPLPGKIARVAEIWAGIITFGIVAAGVILFRKPNRGAQSRGGVFRWTWMRKLRAFGGHISEQVRAIGRSPLVLCAFGISFLKFAVQCLAFLFLLWAYHFSLPLRDQLAVFLIAYVGLSMPSTPASVGVFQLFCIAGLEMVHVAKPVAAGFALLAFAVLTAPLAAAGSVSLAQSGLTLRQVREEASRWTPRNS